jgi:uncharacterized protein (DUF1015 family)
MPAISAFDALVYSPMLARTPSDLSPLVAPPYDVLDAAGKARLLARSERNIVAVDLPHIPAKELGPPAAYSSAAETLASWRRDGTLARAGRPVMFVYRQSFTFNGRAVDRTGLACLVDLRPFGPASDGTGGILPHEETFSGPKEDRAALLRATQTQLSPIFGLHPDALGSTASLLREAFDAPVSADDSSGVGPAHTARSDDGTLHTIRVVRDAGLQARLVASLKGEYTTSLSHLRELESRGHVPADHPARRVMFVLVSMSDPGLVIGPTHRVLGGMTSYSFDALLASSELRVTPAPGDPAQLERAVLDGPANAGPRVGLYDFATGRSAVCEPAHADPLAARFPRKPRAWRDLDVAFCQYVLVESICQTRFNEGNPVRWAFPHSIPEVVDIGAGVERGSGGGSAFNAQLAVIVRPTPLSSVRDVSLAGELMPQKSTFFLPKLATGLFMWPHD